LELGCRWDEDETDTALRVETERVLSNGLAVAWELTTAEVVECRSELPGCEVERDMRAGPNSVLGRREWGL
jgi:hypothetical protein